MVDAMDEKILDTIKAPLGLPVDYVPFDVELLIHINSVISTLNQLGVGPRDGLIIDRETTWAALLEDNKKLEVVKSYAYLKVKLMYDIAAMGPHTINSYQKMADEMEWRIIQIADPMLPQMLPFPEEV